MVDTFKSIIVKNAKFTDFMEFPMIDTTNHIPVDIAPFHQRKRVSSDSWIHFYIDDYRFECLWNNPQKYIPILQKHKGIITPDFSMFRDTPLAMQIWNTYRNRALAFYLQRSGLNIIPNVSWGDERSYYFAFEGLPSGGTVAIGTVGSMKNKKDKYYFHKGLEKMVQVVMPNNIICVGHASKEIFKEIESTNITLIQFEGHTKKYFMSKA